MTFLNFFFSQIISGSLATANWVAVDTLDNGQTTFYMNVCDNLVGASQLPSGCDSSEAPVCMV